MRRNEWAEGQADYPSIAGRPPTKGLPEYRTWRVVPVSSYESVTMQCMHKWIWTHACKYGDNLEYVEYFPFYESSL